MMAMAKTKVKGAMTRTRTGGNFLEKAPQDHPPPPPNKKLYKKLGILGQQIFCTVLKGGPPLKLYKTPS